MSSEIFRPLGGTFTFSLGKRGEMFAWGYLSRAGYHLLEKNYRTRLGEIDIVAQKGERLYFIEVKTRSTADKGLPAEAVTPEKQRKIARLALAYLKAHNELNRKISFGVFSLLWQPPAEPEVCWLENAFSLEEGYSA